MSENCPFCGAEHDKTCNPFNLQSYSCGAFVNREGKLVRSRPECYENEIAAQAALLRECLEVVEAVANGLCCDLVMSGYGYEVKYDIAHETKNQAAALLPRVRKMVGD
jgi:hypothetical protein